MFAITFNPGFALLIAALIVLAAPKSWRAPVMALAGAAALWPMLDRDFGSSPAIAQIGLSVVLLDLKPLPQVFGIAFVAAVIMLAIYSSARRNRYEDAAILLLAGGATSALFVGDYLSFVAAASLAGLAAVWVVLASPVPGSNGAGVRLLIWHGIEGLLFLGGLAFHLSADQTKAGEAKVFGQLDVASLGGALMFAALMIRVGAPLAHVWLKDAVSYASGAGGAALSAFTTTVGVYALARWFPGAAPLVPIGVAMMAIGGVFAAAVDDARRVVAYAQTAQTGVCLVLIGLGSPMALAGAAAHAFTTLFAFVLLQMALGSVLMRTGAARVSAFAGVARAMPLSTAFITLGALALAALPGLSPYVSQAVALAATADAPHRFVWLAIEALSAVMATAVALRFMLGVFLPGARGGGINEAPFPMQLAGAIAGFFCVAIGLNPDWLYDLLPPSGLRFAPFTVERFAPQLELLGVSAAVYGLLRALRLTSAERPARLLDLDAFYRGPIAAAAQFAGRLLLQTYGALLTLWNRVAQAAGRGFTQGIRILDQPYRPHWTGAAQLAAFAALLAIIFVSRR